MYFVGYKFAFYLKNTNNNQGVGQPLKHTVVLCASVSLRVPQSNSDLSNAAQVLHITFQRNISGHQVCYRYYRIILSTEERSRIY